MTAKAVQKKATVLHQHDPLKKHLAARTTLQHPLSFYLTHNPSAASDHPTTALAVGSHELDREQKRVGHMIVLDRARWNNEHCLGHGAAVSCRFFILHRPLLLSRPLLHCRQRLSCIYWIVAGSVDEGGCAIALDGGKNCATSCTQPDRFW